MTGNVSFLVNVRQTRPCIAGFSDRICLRDVLLVPNLDCTLISVSKLLRHTNCFALFTDTICFLQDRSSKTLIGAGEERDGVYFFKDVRVARDCKAEGTDDQLLWHKRLGHPAVSVFSTLPELSGVKNKACSSPCDVCFRESKQEMFFLIVSIKQERFLS